MLPIGYMLKKIIAPPAWIDAPSVGYVYSVSRCVSKGFMDYIPLWRHNCWWLFDDPTTILEIGKEHGLDLSSLSLFYYEMFENEYDADIGDWKPIEPGNDFFTAVKTPGTKRFSGFDVVTYSLGNAPECSPLSCNMLTQELTVNQFCLFDEFDRAYSAVDRRVFNDSEPGPYRIIAVYAIDDHGGI